MEELVQRFGDGSLEGSLRGLTDGLAWALLGAVLLRRPVAVKRCSVFDPPTAVACRRRCLDPTFRRRYAVERRESR